VILACGVVMFLQVPERRVQAETVTVVVHVHGESDRRALLVRHTDRWAGRMSDFPPGSVAHVWPRASPGFFLVRDADGSFRALSDRSPHLGQLLEFRDPLPGTSNYADGPRSGFYDPDAGSVYTLGGEPLQGPGPRPPDPFPLAVEGDRVEIATRALCPPYVSVRPTWCGSGEGPRALAAGQTIVLLPAGAQLHVLGGPAIGASRSVGDQELRAWGAEVAHSAPELEQQAAAGARVLWLHQEALSLLDPAWVRSQYEQGRAVGVLNGTMADLNHWFGLGENSPGWIQPGTSRPVFALVQQRRCEETNSSGLAQTSEWLSLGFWVAISQRAAADPCVT